MTWLEEHLDEQVAHYAAEDGCSVEEWRARAILYVARRRYELEAALTAAHERSGG